MVLAWYLFGFSGCLSPILYSTVNTIVKDDLGERALIMVWLSNLLFESHAFQRDHGNKKLWIMADQLNKIFL